MINTGDRELNEDWPILTNTNFAFQVGIVQQLVAPPRIRKFQIMTWRQTARGHNK